MPLNSELLALDILNILDDQAKRTENPKQARQDFARQLAQAITKHIQTGTVTTAGTATAQTGTIK